MRRRQGRRARVGVVLDQGGRRRRGLLLQLLADGQVLLRVEPPGRQPVHHGALRPVPVGLDPGGEGRSYVVLWVRFTTKLLWELFGLVTGGGTTLDSFIKQIAK